MKISQIYELLNSTVEEITGNSNLVLEDLSNVVDVGNEIISTDNVDNYVKKLVNHIGKVIFDDRVYKGNVPSVLMDSWEFGSILQKITADLPKAQENKSWNLQDGETYNQDIFYQPKVSAKFYNSKVTFEIPVSFTETQVKESFSNKEQLNGFMTMIFNAVENAMTLKIDSLVMKAINNMTAETMLNELKDVDTGTIDLAKSGNKAINLLKLYNDQYGTTLTADKAYTDAAFIRYSSYIINLYKDRLTKVSTLFNIGEKERFTAESDLSIVLLSDFASASNTFLASDVFNKDLISLPNFETVPYWQGSGLNYGFNDVSKIHVKTVSNEEVDVSGVIGIMFDKRAVGVANLDKRVTTNYNAKAEFYTNFYKLDAGYFNDLNENFIVLFIG
jgi:hypothetical protein